MNILLAASEAAPFAKTGGLADVAGALPIEIARQGHAAALIMPLYAQCRQAGIAIEPLGVSLSIPIGSKTVAGSLHGGRLPDSDVPIYFVAQDEYYQRSGLYADEQDKDYVDNCERFTFFSRAALEAIRLLDLDTDVLHLNDWQTGLAAALLAAEYRFQPGYEDIVSVFTIHNLAYQGQFWHWDMALTGLDWKYFNWHQMEFYGHLNLMKTGLVFADALTTVSPRYALEIQTADQGCGLEGVLQQRRDVLSGILNGVDYTQWNPQTDALLPAQYGVETFDQGKAACKAALQRELGLPQRPETPLVGIVGRLSDQKGWDLIAKVMQDFGESRDVQWAILGTGQPKYHELLAALAKRYPQRIAAHLGFSNAVAHRIEAGADLFLMPSRYEPCGLNQMYSLKYGTVPVVRATGGLADTIVDASEVTLANGTANGFSFEPYDAAALASTLDRALAAFGRTEVWDQLIATGMRQDFSWAQSARRYVQLYERTLARARQPVCQ